MRKLILMSFSLLLISLNAEAFSKGLSSKTLVFSSGQAWAKTFEFSGLTELPNGGNLHSTYAGFKNLACDPPEISTIVNCNPQDGFFTVTVEVNDLGSAGTVVVSDDQNSAPQTLNSPGDVTVGPYPYDAEITIIVADEDDSSCATTETVSSANCPPLPCIEADPFCADEDENLEFPNSVDTGQPVEGPDYGCFSSQPNPVWYFLQIQDPGVIEIEIGQSSPGSDVPDLDVDFVMWGPFDDLEEGCTELMNGVAPIQFGYSASYTETIGIGTQGGSVLAGCDGTSTPPPAENGEIYIILITNYSNQEGSIELDQDNAGDDDAGSTNCNMVLENNYVACEGEEIELETSNPGRDYYIWSVLNEDTDEFDIITDGEGDEFESITVSESGEYKCETYTDDGVDSEMFYVEFSPKPELGNLNEVVSLCGVDSVTLDGTATNAGEFGTMDYQWYDQDGNPIDGANGPTLEVSEPGTYTIEVSGTIIDYKGNEAEDVCMKSMTVEVTEGDFEIDLGGDQSLCGQDSYDITAEVSGMDMDDGTFEWTDSDGNVIGDTQTITVSETDVYSVHVEIAGCATDESVYIEFNDPPEIDLGDDILACTLEDIVLDATPVNDPQGEIFYEWSFNGEPIAEDGPTVNPDDYGFGTYSVVVYAGDPDCETSGNITIEEGSDFGVNLDADTELNAAVKYCENDPESLQPYQITFTASLIDADESEVEFTWYKNEVEIPDAESNSYTVTYDEGGDFEDVYTVEVNMGNCTATASLTAEIHFEPYDHPCKITEGLSPGNHDGINDYLDLTFLNDRSGIDKFEVYNRYGYKVFEAENYTDSWHGQDDNGDDLVTGTYYYIIKFHNEDTVYGKVKKGWIYVNQKIN